MRVTPSSITIGSSRVSIFCRSRYHSPSCPLAFAVCWIKRLTDQILEGAPHGVGCLSVALEDCREVVFGLLERHMGRDRQYGRVNDGVDDKGAVRSQSCLPGGPNV